MYYNMFICMDQNDNKSPLITKYIKTYIMNILTTTSLFDKRNTNLEIEKNLNINNT